MDKILELKESKMDKIGAMRKLLDTADAEKRSMTPEEDADYRKLDGEIDQLDKDILAAEKDEERRKKLVEMEQRAKVTQKAPAVIIKDPAGGIKGLNRNGATSRPIVKTRRSLWRPTRSR